MPANCVINNSTINECFIRYRSREEKNIKIDTYDKHENKIEYIIQYIHNNVLNPI